MQGSLLQKQLWLDSRSSQEVMLSLWPCLVIYCQGDELLLLGMPYDTLQTVIGIGRDIPCSLSEYGVKYRVL